MLGRILLIFIAVPLLELFILLDIGRAVGTGPTIILIIGTGIIGAMLARNEGFKTVTAIQQKLSVGEMPAEELLDGLIILIAGVVLITPGVLTDLFGFLLLFKPTRDRFKLWLKSRFSGRISSVNFSGGFTPPADQKENREN